MKFFLWFLVVVTSGYTVYVVCYIYKKNSSITASVISSVATTSNQKIESVALQVPTSTAVITTDSVTASTSDCSITKVMTREQFGATLHDGIKIIANHEALVKDTDSIIEKYEKSGKDMSQIKESIKVVALGISDYKSCIAQYDDLTLNKKDISGFSNNSCTLAKKCGTQFTELKPKIEDFILLYEKTFPANNQAIVTQNNAYQCTVPQKTPTKYLEVWGKATDGLDKLDLAYQGVKKMLDGKGVGTTVLGQKAKVYSDSLNSGKVCIASFKQSFIDDYFTKDLCTKALECNGEFIKVTNEAISIQKELIKLYPNFTDDETQMIARKYPVLFE